MNENAGRRQAKVLPLENDAENDRAPADDEPPIGGGPRGRRGNQDAVAANEDRLQADENELGKAIVKLAQLIDSLDESIQRREAQEHGLYEKEAKRSAAFEADIRALQEENEELKRRNEKLQTLIEAFQTARRQAAQDLETIIGRVESVLRRADRVSQQAGGENPDEPPSASAPTATG